MIRVKDHQTERLFDPWNHFGPKRRRLLDQSWAGAFRKFLFKEIPAHKIFKCFHKSFGRPTKELYTAIGVTILQQIHDLPDEKAIELLAFSEQWHYALDITGESDDEKYLCEKTLRTYRKLLIQEKLDTVIFEGMTDELIKSFHVDTAKQRLDSSHIFSNMRNLRRLEIFVKTIQKFLKKLKIVYKGLFDSLIPVELQERYLSEKSDGCFSQVKPSASSQTLQQVGEDLLYLVELFSSNKDVKKFHSYRLLQRVLSEQCTVTGKGEDKKLSIKPAKEVSSDSLQNPSDSDATYDGHKGKGFQVQTMETYQDTEERDKTKPNLITYVDVEQAHEHDSDALQPALDNTQDRDCCPEEVQCDTLYGSDENVQQAKEKGIKVIAPVCGPTNSPATRLKDFEFDESTQLVTCCPEGHKPIKVRRLKNRMTARFSKKHCSECQQRENCPVTPLKKGDYSLRYNEKHFRLALRRANEETPEFRNKYRWRAGIEATESHLKSDFGAGRLRVRGLPQVRFAVTLKALGLNIFRSAKALKCAYKSLFILFFGYVTFRETHKPKLYPVSHSNDLLSYIFCQRTIYLRR